MANDNLQLHLLGHPQITVNGEQIFDLTSLKSQALLFYLAMQQRALTRVSLAGLLWADKTDDEARVNLRQALRQIVKSLPDAVMANREAMTINQQLVQVDVKQFEELSQQESIEALEQAATLYKGDFLEGFYLENTLAFDDWRLVEQERLRALALQLLSDLAKHFADVHDLGRALGYSKQLLGIEPFHEAGQRRLMRLLALQGNYRLALMQYTTYHKQLQQELGLQPSLETITLYQRVKRLSLLSPSNLPSEFSPLIGRKKELDEVTELLMEDNRLVTLLGSGGVGKTRFALTVAQNLQSRYLEGIIWVELAGLSSESFVAASIASSLGIRLSGKESAETQLIAFLKDKELMLVLDNFEHLLSTNEAVDLVQSIWKEAPNVHLLVTSRVRLNLRAEYTYVIDQLAFPDMQNVKPEHVSSYESVMLFTQVSSRAGKSLTSTAELNEIGQICQFLEGMPLAIEMVAAVTPEIPLETMQTALSENLADLSSSMRDVPQRQRSLQATFNYSLALLNQTEKDLLFKLSVFRGGFSLEAAQDIANANQAQLAKLTAHSLIRLDNNRYSLHEVIRQLAKDKLETQKNVEAKTLTKHRHFFADKLEVLEAKLRQADAQKAMDWFTLELSNIQLAWQSAAETSDEQAVKKSLNSLITYYNRVGPASTANSLISKALECLQHNPTNSKGHRLLLFKLSLAKASIERSQNNFESSEVLLQNANKLLEPPDFPDLLYKSYLANCRLLMQQGRYNEALPLLLKTLDSVPSSDTNGKIDCLDQLGVVSNWLGKEEKTENYFREAYLLAKKSNEASLLAKLNMSIGNFRANQGQAHQSIKHFQEAIKLFESLGDRGYTATCLVNMGTSFDLIGDYTRSRQSYEEASNVSQFTGQQHEFYAALTNLGRVEHFLGNYEAAYTNYQATQIYYQEKVMKSSLSICKANLALLAHNLGNHEVSIELTSEAIDLAEDLNLNYFALFGHLFKAHAEQALAQLEKAAQSYQKVINICQEINLPPQEMEALAGQACVAVDQRDNAFALSKIEPVLDFLRDKPEADGAEEPLRLYLSCYTVLKACEDSRAQAILETAYEVLMGRAEKLKDKMLEESYLNNVLVHRELVAAYKENLS